MIGGDGLLISKRVAFGTIILMAVLIIVWIVVSHYGGEKASVGGDEYYFYSYNYEKDDSSVIYFINDETTVLVCVTDENNADKAKNLQEFNCLTDHDYIIEPYEKKKIDFTVPEDGRYGLLVTSKNYFERATFRIQVIEPITVNHFRYSIFVPIIFLIIIILVSLIYSSYLLIISTHHMERISCSIHYDKYFNL